MKSFWIQLLAAICVAAGLPIVFMLFMSVVLRFVPFYEAFGRLVMP